jgi:D-alanyl-D-alanine carboxypeptidase
LGPPTFPPEPLTSGLARGYLPPDNPHLPGPGLVDATELDLPFNWAGGGIVSTARDLAQFLQALLAGELFARRLRGEMLTTVPSGWEESDAYGLGIEQMTSLMAKSASPCGAALGHVGFSPGYTTIALGSESGDRQVVVTANVLVTLDESWEALGRVVWAGYCGIT